MARPTKPDKKQAISLKLPPYLLEWLDRQPESRAVLIETALNGWFQIPSEQLASSAPSRVDEKKSTQ